MRTLSSEFVKAVPQKGGAHNHNVLRGRSEHENGSAGWVQPSTGAAAIARSRAPLAWIAQDQVLIARSTCDDSSDGSFTCMESTTIPVTSFVSAAAIVSTPRRVAAPSTLARRNMTGAAQVLGRQAGLHCVCRASGMLERTVAAGDALLAPGLPTIPATRPPPGTDMPLALLYPWSPEENDATVVRFTIPNHSNHCKASVHCTASTRT